MLVMLSAPFPLFVTVTVCAGLVVPTTTFPKLRLVGETVITGAVPDPVPARGTVCGLPPPLSVTLTEAERAPSASGVKVAVIVQLPPAGTLDPQVLVSLKSLVFAPVRPMLVMESPFLVLVFVKVIVCSALLLPTAIVPKLRLDGENETSVPWPVMEIT